MDHAHKEAEAREKVDASLHRRDETANELDSATLARLLDEVRNNDVFEAGAYNRMHNRHNR